MPWMLETIGGQPSVHASYKFGPGQSLPQNKGIQRIVPDEETWPIIIQQVNTVKNNLDFTIGPFTSVTLVTVKFKNLVEKFEPGLHHFIPVEMHSLDGAVDGEGYFIFMPGQILDLSIVIDESDLMESSFKGVVRRYGPTSQTPRIMWKESAVKGKHIWVDRFYQNGLAVSDQFYAEAKSLGLKGWLAMESRIKADV